MINRFAYRTTGLAIKTITNLSKARISYHGEKNIPQGPNIFVINHFTRLETFLMPYIIFRLTKIPVWSLASFELFKGAFGTYLEKVGALSTKMNIKKESIVDAIKDIFAAKGQKIIDANLKALELGYNQMNMQKDGGLQ